jgi:hypothetical protein
LASPDETVCAVSLDEQMDVISLHAEVQQAEPLVRCDGQCLTDDTKGPASTERRNLADSAERDVDGRAGIVRAAATVRYEATTRAPWASGAGAATTPGAKGEHALRRATHLDLTEIISSFLSCQMVIGQDLGGEGTILLPAAGKGEGTILIPAAADKLETARTVLRR